MLYDGNGGTQVFLAVQEHVHVTVGRNAVADALQKAVGAGEEHLDHGLPRKLN